MTLDWSKEVEQRKHDIIKETQRFLRIKSVKDPSTIQAGAPFGKGIMEALQHLLNLGKEDGFTVKNVDGYAGHIELGTGKDLVGVLCHVDVVPEGRDWDFDPFGAIVHEGKIMARGAIDDKGPTMAAYFALKIVKELQLPLTKRVRLIAGTDEESNWQCVKYYFEQEEKPKWGFAPDADFPIIYAEKGILDVLLRQSRPGIQDTDIKLVEFHSGTRLNMVPAEAKATITVVKKIESEQMKGQYQRFLQEHGLIGEVNEDHKGTLTLMLKGFSAHGMEPDKGINAGVLLATFLQKYPFQKSASDFIDFIGTYFQNDSRGRKLAINQTDEITGPLTVNVGIISYEESVGGSVSLNIRYPVSAKQQSIMSAFSKVMELYNLDLEVLDHSAPHYVDKNHPLIETLQGVYERQTGMKADLLAIGGATYARAMEGGVAFGPLFPGREEVAHQRNEYIYVDDLLKATAIYAEAIYELAK